MRLMAWTLGDLPQDAELRKEIRIQQAMNLVRQLPTLFSVNLACAARWPRRSTGWHPTW
jgi:hypothetical protein